MTDKKRETLKAKIVEQMDELTTEELEVISGGGIVDVLNNIPLYTCTSCGRNFKAGEYKIIVNNTCPDCGGIVGPAKVKNKL